MQPVAAGMEGHLPYLAQEYVAAESLDIAMKHYAPAAPARVMTFLRQLAGAIDAAATSGILHGGLHPRDIFLTTDEARATGFGIVQAIENIGFRAPTRRPYTAPERVNGEEWGVAADVFSLGAIAHELLTARRPAGPGDQDGSFAADVPAEHRARLREVLARALSEDPAARFVSAGAFVDALEAAAEGQRMEPAPISAAPVAAATAAAAAAPSLFDQDDEAGDVEEVEDVDDIEDADDVEDVDDIEDVGDVEDTGDVGETPSVTGAAPIAPNTPLAPIAIERDDEWPPRGFATEDLDIVSEKETDEALGDFELDLNRGDRELEPELEPEPEPYTPSPEETAAAAAAAEEFEYDTGAEEDEDHPGPAAVAAAAAATPGVRVAGPFAAEEPSVIREPAPSWRPSASVSTTAAPLHDRPASSALGTLAKVAAGVALGLFLGWAIFARDDAADSQAPAQTQTEQPVQQAAPPSQPVTEVPVPSAATPPASSTPTPATDAAPAAPTSGRLLIRSTPTNAMVVIDNVWSGRTPLTKRDVPFGTHVIRVRTDRDTHEPVTQRITLTPENASRELSFELRRRPAARGGREQQPASARETRTPVQSETAPPAGPPAPGAAAGTGTLVITSRPQGARILLNGRFIGNTPTTLPGVAPGSYTVRIELEGYRPYSTSVTLSRNETRRVPAPLVPQDNR